jgi:5-methyltetrahydrofolate--homocysteine methyltransferase
MSVRLEELAESVQNGDAKRVRTRVQEALRAGTEPTVILEQGLVPGLQALGRLFQDGRVYLPEVLIASRAMNSGVELLKPYLAGRNTRSQGKVLLGTAEGDLHDIGKNLVKMMLAGNGFDVFDLGVDVSVDRFAAETEQRRPDIVAVSCLLTTTMRTIPEIVRAVRGTPGGAKVKFMVGGAPVTRAFADEIEVEGYAADCAAAADEAKKLLSQP